jgi:hypothetical protein
LVELAVTRRMNFRDFSKLNAAVDKRAHGHIVSREGLLVVQITDLALGARQLSRVGDSW